MKLTILGGGGVRSPLLAKSIINRAAELGINHVVFMDNNKEKIDIFGALAKNIAKIINKDVKFELSTDGRAAITDADYVITTLRVGGDMGRAADEKIALDKGVLGQETTGAGGFAMAMRSIPALAEYCKLVKEVAKPGALVFNFTNPSGLVAQALSDMGYDFVIGICDGPSEFIKELERLLSFKHGELDVTCFGLNHLSWYSSVKKDGKEILPEILENKELHTSTEMRVFDPDLLKDLGMLANGYLYYYYHREKAIANIVGAGKTRGLAIADINERMLKELDGIDIDQNFDEAMSIYLKHYYERESSYMSIESGSGRGEYEGGKYTMDYTKTDNDGYAGVALNIVKAIKEGAKSKMILSVPNAGTMPFLDDKDIIEVTCDITKDGIKPVNIGEVPRVQELLIRQVKLYEKLAAKAIINRDKKIAIRALYVHPLVNSYSIAKDLVNEYLEAHKEYIGEWK